MLYKNTLQNISEAIELGTNSLIGYSPTPRLDTEILLAFILKNNREFLYSNFEKKVSLEIYKDFINLIEKRRQKYPIAYITGKKEFFGETYKVTEDVLVPRPETENLIEIILQNIQTYFIDKKKIRILEIGSGSGCIPITLKKLLGEKIIIYSYEISEKAYLLAKTNYKLINPGNIIFKNIDAFKNIPPLRTFDIIISNPPYLSKIDMDSLDKDVRFEPEIALYGGTDGLKYYRKLLGLINLQLKNNGFAVFEINENLGKETAAIFQNKYNCRIIKDYFDKDRFIFISLQ